MLKVIGADDSATSHALNLCAEPASSIAVLGPAASGKTRYALALCGLNEQNGASDRVWLDNRRVIDISPDERARMIGFVPSDAALALSGVMGDVRGELELAWRLLGLQPDHRDIERHARHFGLEALLRRDPQTLSGGEKARLALAIATVKQPCLVVLDQLLDHLDAKAIETIRHGLSAVLPKHSILFETRSRRLGATVMSDHPVAGTHDERSGWEVAILPRACPDLSARSLPIDAMDAATPSASVVTDGAPKPLLKVERLHYRYPKSGFSIGPIDLSVAAGERVALTAPSGAGKTTLLKCLALLLQPGFGTFEVRAESSHPIMPPVRKKELHSWARSALYCFQRPEDQLYLPTARAELLETSRRVGRSDDGLALEIAAHFGLDAFLDMSPFDLPRPHRRLLVIASTLAARSPVLLLDEPTATLDDAQVKRLDEALRRYAMNSATVMVTHDQAFLHDTASRVLDLRDMIADGVTKVTS